MKNTTFLTALFVLLASLPLWVQAQYPQANASSDEAAHLREQIEHIILNTQKDLEESDSKLKAASQRIGTLEEENQMLKAQIARSREHEGESRRQLARKLEKAEEANQRVLVENMLLKKQLETLRISHEQALEAQKEIQDRASMKNEAMDRQQRRTYQELENQFQLAGREILRLKETVYQFQSELSDLRTSYQTKLDQLSQQNKVLSLQVNGLTTQLQATQNQARKLVEGRLGGQQLIDSLRYELATQGRMLDILNRADRVNRDRIARLEAGEKALETEKKQIDVRRQLLVTREQALSRQKEDLMKREERYRNLEAKEKQLKLLEQQLRQQGYSAQNNGAARGQ